MIRNARDFQICDGKNRGKAKFPQQKSQV